MAERPMLMSAPMVRAILDGTKTQTRRVVKPQPTEAAPGPGIRAALYRPGDFIWPDKVPGCSIVSCKPHGPDGWAAENSPYGRPGDRLWVRETFQRFTDDGGILYKADPAALEAMNELKRDECLEARWRPAIHMPRWASRITLEITGVRVERLQGISDDDLSCEGLQEVIDAGVDHDGTPRDAWRALWSAINGPDSWAANPWVWVVEFRRNTP